MSLFSLAWILATLPLHRLGQLGRLGLLLHGQQPRSLRCRAGGGDQVDLGAVLLLQLAQDRGPVEHRLRVAALQQGDGGIDAAAAHVAGRGDLGDRGLISPEQPQVAGHAQAGDLDLVLGLGVLDPERVVLLAQVVDLAGELGRLGDQLLEAGTAGWRARRRRRNSATRARWRRRR